MFQELMPLLAHRTLILTLSRVDGEEICVNVIPKPLKSSEKDTNNAITTPLSLTGTPAELDQELPKQLVGFVGSHLQLTSTLRSAKEEMETAAKAARESARKSTSSRSTASPTKSSADSVSLPENMTAAPNAVESKPDPSPAMGSLFESQETQTIAEGTASE